MPDKKISDLTQLEQLDASTDVLPVVDLLGNGISQPQGLFDPETKKIKLSNLPMSNVALANSFPYTVYFKDSAAMVTTDTAIIDSSFDFASSDVDIYIGTKVTGIADQAFQNSNITSVVIPDSVVAIGENAFLDCASLTSVKLSERLDGGNEQYTIGHNAFRQCTSLTSIDIPEIVNRMGESVFRSCTSLTSATIGATLMGDNTFMDCTNLSSVTIRDSVTGFGVSVFQNCTSLTSIVIPKNVRTIAESAFSSSALTSVVLSSSMNSISDSTFDQCTSLASVTIPEGVTSIGNNAFQDNTSLKTITLPNSMLTIGNLAFYQSGLTKIVIPNKVTSIGEFALASMTSLTDLTIGSGVTSIGNQAFDSCTSLTNILSLATTAPTLSTSSVFDSVLATQIHVPPGSKASYETAGDGTTYGGLIIVDDLII